MGYIFLILLAGFLGVLIFRALLFTPKPQPSGEGEPVTVDREAAVAALQELVRCKTVSYPQREREDEAEFEKFIELLPRLYPRVFADCTLTRLPDRGLLLRWKGRSPDSPAVLMAHYDVVPAEEEGWEQPPFAGVIKDGCLWGRGTLDTKVTLNGILFAAQQLISEGFTPQRDVYFAFSGGEEVNGPGAKRIVSWFAQQGIVPGLVLDEGGAVVEGVFPGVNAPCGLIGIGEKGMMNVCYRVRSRGGHASAPTPGDPVSTLARACRRVTEKPFPMKLDGPALALFDTLGRHATFPLRLVFANLWLFRPVLDLICRKQGGEMNALCRTTVAFTMLSGSAARNVLPAEASMISNMRLSPSDRMESAKAYLEKTVKDPNVEIRVLEGFDPSPVSRMDCEGWEKVSRAVAQTWPGCIVAPYLMVQCSDARHYGALSDRVYRFSAMDLTARERKSIHGVNEKIRLESVSRAAEFFLRLMKQL